MSARTICIAALVGLALAALPAMPPAQAGQPANALEKSVFDALLLLPHYGVFDFLSFRMEGTDVTLLGQAMLPITRTEAERRVARIPGIGKVVDRIEVLPVSMNDDHLRMKAYRQLFGSSDLYKYAMGANPAIHIIVKNSRVTLEGVVATAMDAKLALAAVRGLPGALEAASHLVVTE